MTPKLPTSFDDLIKRHYGGTGRGVLDDTSLKELFSRYYGGTEQPKRKYGKKTTSVTMSVTTDDGEVMQQAGYVEYVVQQSHSDCGCCEEYVVEDRSRPALPAPTPQYPRAQAKSFSAEDDGQIDSILAPSRGTFPAPVPVSQPSAAAFSAPEPAPSAPAAPAKSGDPSDDEFFKDLQDIISGKGKFNEETRKVESARQVPPPPPPPMPNSDNGQAIFDRIAQSMSYANAYDLGSVDLENRFAEFDKAADEQAPRPKSKSPGKSDGPRAPAVNTADFIEDMKDMADQARDSATKMAESMAPRSQSQSVEYSRPFFDAGEHAQMGYSGYDGLLRVGPNPGLVMSYGEIIACGDLFETPEKMMAASLDDLRNIQALIQRNVQFYRGGKKNKSLDTSDDDWQGPTHKEYLKLAENNYEHFSPYYYFPKASFAKDVHKHGTNRTQWERFHKQAIIEAQKMFLDPKNQGKDVLYEWPLIINAFADHFLTDAFSAGHLVNKEEIIALFKQNFFSGGDLTKDGKQFFEKVALLAFHGEVAERFSDLETVDYPVCYWGWCLKWHPNINSVSRFGDLLKKAAEQQPDRIANFALKALHDALNKEGVDVTNKAGDAPWKEFGDAFATDANIAVIKKAVQQSIDNINDRAIMGSNLNYSPFFEKVWKHVPTPTPAAQARIISLANEFTNPNSNIGAAAAAEIIKNGLNAMIKLLIDEHKLQKA